MTELIEGVFEVWRSIVRPVADVVTAIYFAAGLTLWLAGSLHAGHVLSVDAVEQLGGELFHWLVGRKDFMEWIIWFLFIVIASAWIDYENHEKARKQRIKAAYLFDPKNAHGGAAFADNVRLKARGLFKGKGIRMGLSPDGRHALHYPGFGHILTVAAARTGKGITLLVNALLSWKGSCLVVDPKCENAAITGHWRRRFGKVYVLNPFGILDDALKGLKQARFNPMDILDPASRSFHADCDKLAAALVWDEGREGIHFTTAARMLISGTIAYLARHGKKDDKTLAAVARTISGDVFAFCREAVSSKDPFIRQKLGRYTAAKAQESREILDVISTAITQLGFIGNLAIAESLSGSDFRFSDLKRKRGTTVYICLPLNKLDICDKYFRLIVETALTDLLNEGQHGRKGSPVLAIIDEFAQLGPHIKSIENAMGMAAGAAGLQLWCVLQDLSQLKGMFPSTWETFIQNCGVTTWFGARDQTTREYVSKLSGTTEVLSNSRSVTIDRRTGEPVVNDSATQFGRPLLLPHEVGELDDNEMIAFVEGVHGAVRARRKPYFTGWEFRGKYRDNPYVKNGNHLLQLFSGR